MIEFQNVSFGYDGNEILQNINLQIRAGEFAAIVGGNGAGKTTTVKLINGLLKPDSGSVRIAGRDTASMKTSEAAKICGFLFQNPDRQICKNTVHDEIAFSLECVGMANVEERIAEITKKLELDPNSDPFSLSRGERQKVALASVLAVQPQILILDEPTTGLDYRECMRIMELVKTLNETGTTVVMVSHDMEIVADFAERVIVVEQGKIVLDGDCREVLANTELSKVSSVLPPQICELSAALGGKFQGCFTVDEFMDVIDGNCKSE